ncbi:MAG: hypothetical protein D6769_02230, partial [Methanobacteriota archaeon]
MSSSKRRSDLKDRSFAGGSKLTGIISDLTFSSREKLERYLREVAERGEQELEVCCNIVLNNLLKDRDAAAIYGSIFKDTLKSILSIPNLGRNVFELPKKLSNSPSSLMTALFYSAMLEDDAPTMIQALNRGASFKNAYPPIHILLLQGSENLAKMLSKIELSRSSFSRHLKKTVPVSLKFTDQESAVLVPTKPGMSKNHLLHANLLQ